MPFHHGRTDCELSYLTSTYWSGGIPPRSVLDFLTKSIAEKGCKNCETLYEEATVCRVCMGFDRRSMESFNDFPYEMPFDELEKSAVAGCENCEVLEEGLKRVVADDPSIKDLSGCQAVLGCTSRSGDIT